MRSFTGLAGFLLVCLTACFITGQSQGLYPITTDQKVSHSSLIIEGKVIEKKSFWNKNKTMIYTSNLVEVYKVFKGTTQKNTIEIITTGGAVGDYYIHASHLLELEKEDVGVFFCKTTNRLQSLSSAKHVFEVYSSSQGFLKYDLFSKSATAPFSHFDDIERTLYKEINSRTGVQPVIKNRYFTVEGARQRLQGNNSTLAPDIASFSPATVHAGALLDPNNNELTINGSGFGSAPGGSAAVLFSHADFSAGTQFTVVPYNSKLIVSWRDDQIKVKVPTQAGTGVFRVRDNGGNVVNSPTALQVRFSILTADFGGTYGIKQFNLGNMNNNGGYSIKYSISTANSGTNINASPAKATFQRALNTWKETVGVNFVEAGTSTMQEVNPDDGENLVMYDNGGTGLESGPLADGVLATCFSGITICTSNPVANQARKTGFDIVIRNTNYSSGNTPFTLGPCPPYSGQNSAVDLESVLLHELGHAMNLGHIVDPLQGSGAGTATPAKVMHFSVSYNQRRISLDYSAKAGAEYQVTPHSHTYGGCAGAAPEMTPLTTIVEPKDECPSTFPVAATPMFSKINFDLMHATSNKFVDPSYTQMTANGTGTNITNTAYYPLRTGETTGNLSLEVLNYTTAPAEIEDCPTGGTGIMVTGVKLSVYEVPSCPDGGEYPTPIAYMTFSGNGELPDVPNLQSNTTYLIVVDGIQNTKAMFDLELSGTALPPQSTNLTGEIVGSSNHLNWTTDPAVEVSSMSLERSADGVTFETIREIEGAQQASGGYEDMTPLPGTNYYRIRVQNPNGSIQFSQVLLLNRSEDFSLTIYPTPSGGIINVAIESKEPDVYAVIVYSAYGQKVITKQIAVNTRRHVEAISVVGLARGVYFVSAYGKDGKKIKSTTVKL